MTTLNAVKWSQLASHAFADSGSAARRTSGIIQTLGLPTRSRIGLKCMLAALGLILAGCNGPGGIGGVRSVPPRDAAEAMQRINTNLDKLEGALHCPARVSFRFLDDQGKDRRFIGHQATVIFETPRCLYFDIKHALGGSVARIGSNDESYWLWLDTPEVRKLWHGTWASLQTGASRPIAIPPDRLLDALMMRPLPTWLDGALNPLLRIHGHDHRLLFVGLDRRGWPYVKRELRLDPNPPYLPLEMIDRDRDGRILMHVYLSDYRRVRDGGADAPYTPRKYVVYWELDHTEMRLDLSNVKYRSSDAPFCEFPESWEGARECLDAPLEEYENLAPDANLDEES